MTPSVQLQIVRADASCRCRHPRTLAPIVGSSSADLCASERRFSSSLFSCSVQFIFVHTRKQQPIHCHRTPAVYCTNAAPKSHSSRSPKFNPHLFTDAAFKVDQPARTHLLHSQPQHPRLERIKVWIARVCPIPPGNLSKLLLARAVICAMLVCFVLEVSACSGGLMLYERSFGESRCIFYSKVAHTEKGCAIMKMHASQTRR
jgi:hypothetical protein